MPKKRLDLLLVERGLVETRSLAQRLIMAGEVLVDGQPVLQSGSMLPATAALVLKNPPRFVSRGGEKLAAAIEAFRLDAAGWICADIGASTGGFTDCLLQHGARRVYAIDVGKGILDWRLRNDPRVTVMEETNARYVEHLPEALDLVTVDASFISLQLLLPAAAGWLKPEGRVVALVKPQFEAGKGQVGKGGVVRDSDTHRRVLRETIAAVPGFGLYARGLIRSPLRGPAGNIEFLLWLDRTPPAGPVDEWIASLRLEDGE